MRLVLIILIVVVLGVVPVQGYGGEGMAEEVFVEGDLYVCPVGKAVTVELPEGGKYRVLSRTPAGWQVERFYRFVWVAARSVGKDMVLKIGDKRQRQVEIRFRSVDGSKGQSYKIVVVAMPVQARAAPGLEGKGQTEFVFSLAGGLSSIGKGQSRLDVGGQAVLAGKIKGLFGQAAGMVEVGDLAKRFGFSAGVGYEPGNWGLFLFTDSLFYQYEDWRRTFHVQVRPALRIKGRRFRASAFLALNLGKARYTGQDVVEEGLEYGIFNRAFSHAGLQLEALVLDRLLLRLKALAAAGSIFKIDFSSSYRLSARLSADIHCQYSAFGSYPLLRAEGFDNLARVSAGLSLGLGSVDRFKDQRQRIMFEPDYPLISQVKKRKEPERQAPLTASLTARPQSGRAPLPVTFELTIEGGRPPFKMKWQPEPGHSQENSVTRLNHTYTQAGTYRAVVEVGDSRGQQARSNSVTIDVRESGSSHKSHTITATSGKNGTIEPTGEVTVQEGQDQLFTLKPDNGFVVADVRVDGQGRGARSTYRFENVRADHTIHAEFTAAGVNTYTITATGSSGGAISPGGAVTVAAGRDAAFNMTPEYGYRLKQVEVDGQVLSGTPQSYTFGAVKADHTVHAEFEARQFTITSGAGPNGTIEPLGARTFLHGQGQAYTIRPDQGYMIDVVRVDGKPVV